MKRILLCVALWSANLGLVAADDQETALLKLLPASSNVVAVVHADQVLGSARGVKEDWAGRQQDRFLAGASMIPPNVTTLVQGMQVRLETSTLIAATTLMPFLLGSICGPSLIARRKPRRTPSPMFPRSRHGTTRCMSSCRARRWRS